MKKFIIFTLSFIFFIPNINALDIDSNSLVEVKFSSCTDGDTASFKYQNEEIKVRLLAIDTPETKHPTKKEEPFGKDASNYTCNAIKNANKIILEFDQNSDIKDKYERYLAWVFIDDSLLQKKLITKGFAKVAYLYGDYKYTKELQDAEKIAQNNQVGIWGDYKDYTIYYIGGAFFLLIICSLIITKVKNKNIKSLARKSNIKLKKELKSLINKL